MCCSYSLIYGTEPPFKLSTVLNLSTTKRALPNASFRLFCNTQFPILSTKTRIHSFRTKAAINDGFVKTEPSFYDLLGIPETGSLLEIKQAYKQMARKYHPDVSPPGRVEEYTKRFIRVQEAYETLSDPSRRALYDRDMSRGIHLAFSARKRYQNVEVFDCYIYFFQFDLTSL